MQPSSLESPLHPTGLPMLCTGTWVGCKLAFEDIA